MVGIRSDWQERLAEWYSEEADLERAEQRAEELPISASPKGGRPRLVLDPWKAKAVLTDLAARFSYRHTAKKHDVSYNWLRAAHQDGRLEAMADGHYR